MVTKTTEKKVKKRKWHEILSKDFNNIILGEIITKDPNSVLGRVLKVNLGNLIRDIKLQNVTVSFKIVGLDGEKFQTEIYGYSLSSSYTKRIVKTKKTKIDDSFICESKDKIKVRIKPLIVTRNNINRSLATLIRKESIKLIKDYLSKNDYYAFFRSLIDKKFGAEFKKTLNKIYPLSIFEIRIMKRL